MEVEFLKSATRKDEYPKLPLPKVGFVGGSNVGKSSLINSLVGRKGLARISATPGRTRAINFFRVDHRWIFADLPGYGFAKVSKRIRAGWGPMVEEFLKEDEALKLAVLIVDVRRLPSEMDRVMSKWLEYYSIGCQVVATKADKLSMNQCQRSIQQAKKSLQVSQIVPYSATTGLGRNQLWKIIREGHGHG